MLTEERFALGVIAGDLTNYPTPQELRTAKAELSSTASALGRDAVGPLSEVFKHALKMKERRYKQLLFAAGKPVLFLMGNDDGILGDGLQWADERKVICINQKRATCGGFDFVGYHYTPMFVGGTFEKPESTQVDDLAQLQKLLDDQTILVTHGPPKGILDITYQGRHAGSKALAAMLARRPVWLHLFGHIHESFGKHGNSVNGAYPAKEMFVDIDVETRTVSLLK
jgi:Icc-related predicted phosphoesterase